MERIPEMEAIADMQQARRFNQVMAGGMIQQEYRQLARELLKLGLPADGKVLDVGTGTGFAALAVAECLRGSGRVTGLDLSQAMLSLAAENAQSRHLQAITAWKLGDAGAMPFNDGEFDAVLSSGSLHHWMDPEKIINEIGRVLKPGGIAIIRDSKRLLPGWSLSRFLATLIGWTLPPDFRYHYWDSINSSYTLAELFSIVERSALKGAVIKQDLLDMMVIKE